MDQFVIEAKVRSETGKKAAKAIRAEGRIPAVVYDEAGKATSITVDSVQFNKAWRSITSTTLVTLDVEGKKYDAFIRDTEYNIIKDEVLHADFFAVTNNQLYAHTKSSIRAHLLAFSRAASWLNTFLR